ncbi:MAG: hypothetical protein MJE77_04310 [Proteobacteria bacterium]|nr:hypothetical protein [Pseudomonadota bacterium]
MQISEKFRRGVVMPLDETSAKALEAEDVNDATRVRFIEIASQDEFELLWQTGVFAAINEQTGSLIDDYEEEVIPAEMVSRVHAVALSFAKNCTGGATAVRFFTALADACDVALRAAKPIYFVL